MDSLDRAEVGFGNATQVGRRSGWGLSWTEKEREEDRMRRRRVKRDGAVGASGPSCVYAAAIDDRQSRQRRDEDETVCVFVNTILQKLFTMGADGSCTCRAQSLMSTGPRSYRPSQLSRRGRMGGERRGRKLHDSVDMEIGVVVWTNEGMMEQSERQRQPCAPTNIRDFSII